MRQPSKLQISDLSVFEQELTLEEVEEVVGGRNKRKKPKKPRKPKPHPRPHIVAPPAQAHIGIAIYTVSEEKSVSITSKVVYKETVTEQSNQ